MLSNDLNAESEKLEKQQIKDLEIRLKAAEERNK